MPKLKINDKRLANKRFKKTEEIILQIFFDNLDCVNVQTIAKKAGVTRSTFYTHHRAVKEIIPDYEEYILIKYKRMVKRTLGARSTTIGVVFTRTFIFMMMNKKFFIMFSKFDNSRVIVRMIDTLKDVIVKEAKLTRNKDRIFQIYEGEIEVLMRDWCKEGFEQDEINKNVSNMIYLMNTAKMRLGVLK